MNDDVQAFTPFAPVRSRSRNLARTWWGRDWIDALEQASLDQQELTAGRRIARSGGIGPITIGAGRAAATVDAPDGVFRPVLRWAPLPDRDWARVHDLVARSAGHAAALLDGELPSELVDSARDAGPALLPEIGDLDPDCDCPGWEHPCRHAAALAYQVAWLLDADPFVLFLLRGRSRAELLRQWRRHRNDTEPTTPTPDDAAEAFAAEIAALPPEPVIPPEPASPLVVDDTGIVDVAALRRLAAHAAHRARELLTEPTDVDVDGDLVRLAAQFPQDLERWQAAVRGERDLPRAVRAWELGGPGGLDVLETTWTPRGPWWMRACTELAEVVDEDGLTEPTIQDNHWTSESVQLRCHRDGRWFGYRWWEHQWWPVTRPDRDPVTALTVTMQR